MNDCLKWAFPTSSNSPIGQANVIRSFLWLLGCRYTSMGNRSPGFPGRPCVVGQLGSHIKPYDLWCLPGIETGTMWTGGTREWGSHSSVLVTAPCSPLFVARTGCEFVLSAMSFNRETGRVRRLDLQPLMRTQGSDWGFIVTRNPALLPSSIKLNSYLGILASHPPRLQNWSVFSWNFRTSIIVFFLLGLVWLWIEEAEVHLCFTPYQRPTC